MSEDQLAKKRGKKKTNHRVHNLWQSSFQGKERVCFSKSRVETFAFSKVGVDLDHSTIIGLLVLFMYTYKDGCSHCLLWKICKEYGPFNYVEIKIVAPSEFHLPNCIV